jgi:hypothetical protein
MLIRSCASMVLTTPAGHPMSTPDAVDGVQQPPRPITKEYGLSLLLVCSLAGPPVPKSMQIAQAFQLVEEAVMLFECG